MPALIRVSALDLPLARTFRTSRGGKDIAQNVLVELDFEGVTGCGEGAPNQRYGQSQVSAFEALSDFEAPPESPFDQESWMNAFDAVAPGETAARCALEMALWDWAGQKVGQSLGTMLSIAPRELSPSSWTISIDDPEGIAERVREAAGWPVLKLKLEGGAGDYDNVARLREITDRPFRIDANEAWSLDEAIEKAEWLASVGCELIEQPLAAGQLEATATLKELSPLPLVADEDAVAPVDVDELAAAYDGVNVKLTRLGGIRDAVHWIHALRKVGLDVLLGCFVESSVGITAASHLAPLARWIDLDGAALLASDPFVGAEVRAGRIQLVDGPGLGVRRA